MASPDELAVSGNVAAGRSLLVALTESPKRLSDWRVDHNSNRGVSSPNNAVSLGIGAYEVTVVKFIRPVFGEDLAQIFFLAVGHTVSRAAKADSQSCGGHFLAPDCASGRAVIGPRVRKRRKRWSVQESILNLFRSPPLWTNRAFVVGLIQAHPNFISSAETLCIPRPLESGHATCLSIQGTALTIPGVPLQT
jgi:hypothetical protein